MVWKLTLAIIATFVLGGGVVFAADDAVPGEPLYGLDRATEAIQTRLTGDPEALLSLHLRLAEERLLEAQELAGTQGDALVQKALVDYAASMASVGEIMASADALSQAALLETIEETLSDYSSLLVSLPSLDADEDQDDEDEDDVDDPEDGEVEDNSFCVDEEESHPVAEKLAADLPDGSDVTVEDIMAWFCGGEEEEDLPHFGFGEIKQVLDLSGGNVISATELLETKADGIGWGLIKQAVKLTGGDVFSATELLEAKADGMGWGQIKKEYGSNGESTDLDSTDELSQPTGPGNSRGAGRPDHAGPPKVQGQSAQNDRPDHAGPPQNQGQSGNQGKGKGRGRP